LNRNLDSKVKFWKIGTTNSKFIILISLLLLLSGCSKPLPNDKLDYQGDWQNASVRLIITSDGSVSYKKVVDGMTTTIDAPIKAFIGDDIEVGVGWFTTVFDVSEPPHQIDGQWKMIVDGHLLTKH
jgi:hypothetical protein